VNSKKWTVIREQELTENQIAIEPITICQSPVTNHQLPFTAYTIQTKDSDSRDDLKKKI